MEGAAPSPENGRLLDNIMYFARTLRAAGLPIGPGKVLAADAEIESGLRIAVRELHSTLVGHDAAPDLSLIAEGVSGRVAQP